MQQKQSSAVQREFDFEALDGPPQDYAGVDGESPRGTEKVHQPAYPDSSARQLERDPLHVSHALGRITARLPAPVDEPRSLFGETELQAAHTPRSDQLNAPDSRSQTVASKIEEVPDFVRLRSIPELRPAETAESAFCERYPLDQRRDQVSAFIRKNEILLNRKGGLRRLSSDQQREALQNLGALFSHFPYQVLDFCFREFPRETFGNHRETVTQFQLQQAVCTWIKAYQHTESQVHAWIGVVRRQQKSALANATPGRPLRVGRNAVNAAKAILQSLSR